jgi:hypothetical protein
MSVRGSRARPGAVYRQYRIVPTVIRMPIAKVKARSPSVGSQYCNA